MNTIDDTIAGIATAPGEGGVAIVRVAGPQAFHVADQVFQCEGARPSERERNTFVYGHVVGDDSDIDEALLLIMRAPHSYTCEDMIEIQGHGGRVSAQRILRRILAAGARLAEPGEFTKRAFLNGRIDLLQAEAVLDLVHARSERAAAAALEQLEGNLSVSFNRIYDDLMQVASDLEATLDFPEEDIPESVISAAPSRVRAAEEQIEELVAMWNEGHLLREGALVVIAGMPNVGKSTLLNTLLGTARAIVSGMPGTTRDTIEEGLVFDGIALRLVDTAGLRDTPCDVEREGVERTRQQMERADMHLYVVDASQPLAQEAKDHLEELDAQRTVVVLNKTDLGRVVTGDGLPGLKTVETSLVAGLGVEELKEAMRGMIESGLDLTTPPHAVISERHRKLLVDARDALSEALELLEGGREDAALLSAAHLRTSLEYLGTATGRTYEDDLLDRIFSRFCIGK